MAHWSRYSARLLKFFFWILKNNNAFKLTDSCMALAYEDCADRRAVNAEYPR